MPPGITVITDENMLARRFRLAALVVTTGATMTCEPDVPHAGAFTHPVFEPKRTWHGCRRQPGLQLNTCTSDPANLSEVVATRFLVQREGLRDFERWPPERCPGQEKRRGRASLQRACFA